MKKQMLHNYGLQFGSSFPKALLDVKEKVVVRRRSRCWRYKSYPAVQIRECGRCPMCLMFVESCAVCKVEESQETKRLWELGRCHSSGNGLVEVTYKEEIKSKSARYCNRCVSKRIFPTQIPGKIHDMVLAINNTSLPPAWAKRRFVQSIVFDRKDGKRGKTNNLWNSTLEEGDQDALVIN